ASRRALARVARGANAGGAAGGLLPFAGRVTTAPPPLSTSRSSPTQLPVTERPLQSSLYETSTVAAPPVGIRQRFRLPRSAFSALPSGARAARSCTLPA